MPILLKTQIERTAKTRLPRRRARVGSLCRFLDAAEHTYPPDTRKPDVAPTCGSIAGTENEEKERLQANFGRGRSRKRRGRRKA